MPIPRDDHMVVDSDTKRHTNLDDLLVHLDIGPGWRGFARRVIVHEDAASCGATRLTSRQDRITAPQHCCPLHLQ